MYEIFVKPFKYPGYIYIGIVYLDNFDEILDQIKNYVETKPIDGIYQTTIAEKYKENRYMRISVRDCYNNDKEIYSAIYDIELKNFFKEV